MKNTFDNVIKFFKELMWTFCFVVVVLIIFVSFGKRIVEENNYRKDVLDKMFEYEVFEHCEEIDDLYYCFNNGGNNE